MKKAFTMVELIFVIVIIGILAGIALPRLAGSRDDAELTKAKSQVAAIRAGIQTKRSANLLSSNVMNNSGYPTSLDIASSTDLFGEVLSVGIKPRVGTNSGWSKTTDNSYTLVVNGHTANFAYNPTAVDASNPAGSFVCTSTDTICNLLDN